MHTHYQIALFGTCVTSSVGDFIRKYLFETPLICATVVSCCIQIWLFFCAKRSAIKHAGICIQLKPKTCFGFYSANSILSTGEIHLTTVLWLKLQCWLLRLSLPWGEQMAACSFLRLFLPLRDEEGGHVQSQPAWKNRPLPQKDKGTFWPH